MTPDDVTEAVEAARHLTRMSRDVKFSPGEAEVLRWAAGLLTAYESARGDAASGCKCLCHRWAANPCLPCEGDKPTVKPDRETVASAIYKAMGNSRFDARYWDAADAILALLPGRPEAVVKAEALRIAATLVAHFRSGLNPDDPEGPQHVANSNRAFGADCVLDALTRGTADGYPEWNSPDVDAILTAIENGANDAR